MSRKSSHGNVPSKSHKLAIHGGPKIRIKPWPPRKLISREEKKAVDALFDRAIASGNAFGYNGPEENAFCKQFAKFMGGGYADAVNSGTTAIYVALRALQIEPFKEIIVSPITDPGGMMPIVMLNCIPVVADTVPGSFNTGPEQIEKLISPRTGAILVAHLLGEPADMPGIMRVARKHKIPVVEDCAQSHMATINNRMVGTFGDVAAFSMMFGKHFCTGGQGGMVYTRNEEIYNWSRRFSDRGKPFGLPPGSTNCVATLNFNLNDLAAVIGSVQLKKLPWIVRRRRQIAQAIRKGIRGLKAVSFPETVNGANPSYWYLRLRFNPNGVSCDKETYCKALAAEGMPVNPNYNHMPHTHEWFTKKRAFGTGNFPWSSPHYKGDPNQKFPCPNAVAAIRDHFLLIAYESWGKEEADDIVRIFKKVEKALK